MSKKLFLGQQFVSNFFKIYCYFKHSLISAFKKILPISN